MICAWSFSWYQMISSRDSFSALFWGRFMHFPASFIPATFLHFVLSLTRSKEDGRIVVRNMLYIFGVFFSVLLFSDFFVPSVSIKQGFQYYTDPGLLYDVFFIFFVLAITYIHFLMFASYKGLDGFQRVQMRYVLGSYLFGYLGGVTTFFPVSNPL
jgi:hypothetical protein